jgi:hypothetical protein
VPGGQDLDRVDIDLGDVLAVRPSEVAERVETPSESGDVGGRLAAHRTQQGRAPDLADHRLRVALAERELAQGEVAEHLDGDAPDAKARK